mmetsp:Transcript_3761/g.9956  ORF Transcript_3761/g.9956 Transcript_3761/m.9956 type:complete len:268 (+) Transcript_3761:1478-2281(+)
MGHGSRDAQPRCTGKLCRWNIDCGPSLPDGLVAAAPWLDLRQRFLQVLSTQVLLLQYLGELGLGTFQHGLLFAFLAHLEVCQLGLSVRGLAIHLSVLEVTLEEGAVPDGLGVLLLGHALIDGSVHVLLEVLTLCPVSGDLFDLQRPLVLDNLFLDAIVLVGLSLLGAELRQLFLESWLLPPGFRCVDAALVVWVLLIEFLDGLLVGLWTVADHVINFLHAHVTSLAESLDELVLGLVLIGDLGEGERLVDAALELQTFGDETVGLVA